MHPLVEAGVASSSTTQHGYYPQAASSGAEVTFNPMHESPVSSSVAAFPFLLPAGGAPLPSGSSFSQPARAAVSHRLLVQSPSVYPNSNLVRLVVQCYDAFGNALVAPPAIGITLTMGALSIHDFSLSTSGNVRFYSAALPPSWFAAVSGANATATVDSQLNGLHTQRSSLQVFGDPAWFAARLDAAGVAAYSTSDAGGAVAAEAMRSGDPFFLQLYAHTGSVALSSFEVRLEHDPAVCTPVPKGGQPFSTSFTGEVSGATDGTYATELLKRLQDPDVAGSYFIKYSRFERTPMLTSDHAHLGHVEMRFVAPGACLTSATVTALFRDGSTAMIPGVGTGDAVSVLGNSFSLIADGTVGMVGEVAQGMPIVNTGYLTGSELSATLVTTLFASPSSSTGSSVAVQIGLDDDGTILHSVHDGPSSSQLNLTVTRPPLPALSVDDADLGLISACGIFQSTRLRATAGGVDVARILSFQTSDAAVATIDASGPYPVVSRTAPGQRSSTCARPRSPASL